MSLGSPISFFGWTAMVHASIVRASGAPLRSTMSPRPAIVAATACGSAIEIWTPSIPSRAITRTTAAPNSTISIIRRICAVATSACRWPALRRSGTGRATRTVTGDAWIRRGRR
jgi:hypothetical protein